MIIFIGDWGKKLTVILKIAVLVIILAAAMPGIIKLADSGRTAVKSWSQSHPEFQSLMNKERTQSTDFDRTLDNFVIKLQDFYYEERE
jgi:hypothetical protein